MSITTPPARPRRPDSLPLLTDAELNRATLARQMLLERQRIRPLEAIERLVALQAQEAASPYIALWTRLEGFEARSLDRAFLERQVVKATLLRATLHAVSARDYVRFWPAVAPSVRAWREQTLRRLNVEFAFDELTEQALEFASQPRTNDELKRHLPPLAAGVGPTGQSDSWWAVRLQAPFVNVPSEIPWCFGRRPVYQSARSWIHEPLASEQDGLDELVRRYVGAFGPATVGDAHQFTRIERRRLTPVFERLTPQLRLFRNEAGRVLYDVPDAPLPPADTPAPPRFLPMWDSMLLAYEHKDRVLPDDHRRVVIRVNGDFLPTFLVDGHVAGYWRSDVEDGRTRIRWTPFAPLASGVEEQLATEAERLARFVEPLEPNVYKRYANTWMK